MESSGNMGINIEVIANIGNQIKKVSRIFIWIEAGITIELFDIHWQYTNGLIIRLTKITQWKIKERDSL